MLSTIRMLFAIPLLILLPPGTSFAQPPEVFLQTKIILASDRAGSSEAQLGHLVGELRRVFGYRSYRLLDSPSSRARLGETWRSPLPGGRTLEITPQSIREGWIQLQVRALGKREPLMGSIVRLRSGGTVLVGGPPYEGGVLIIAITASLSP